MKTTFSSFLNIALITSCSILPISAKDQALSTERSRVEHQHGIDHPKQKDIWCCDFLTENWLGSRCEAADCGLDFSLVYTGEIISTLSGGLRRGTAAEGLLDIGLDMDLEKLAGWKGGFFHANAYWLHGSSPTAKYAGDIQTLSNIDGFDTLRLNECWYEHSFFDGKFKVRAGQMSADKEFSTSEFSGLFLNGAFGWPFFIAGNVSSPSFPLGAPGFLLKWEPYEEVYFMMGVYDGDPTPQRLNESGTHFNLHESDGRLMLYETGYRWNQKKGARGLPGICKLGVWQHTDSFADRSRGTDGLSLADPATNSNPIRHQGNQGIYGILDQMLWREKDPVENSSEGLGIFFRAGEAPEDRNLASLQWMTGLNWKGCIPGRDEDILGIAVTRSEMSESISRLDAETNHFNATLSPVRDYEMTMEITWKMMISPWWQLQPDFQWVIHPGGSPAVGDAVAVGLRTTLIF